MVDNYEDHFSIYQHTWTTSETGLNKCALGAPHSMYIYASIRIHGEIKKYINHVI